MPMAYYKRVWGCGNEGRWSFQENMPISSVLGPFHSLLGVSEAEETSSGFSHILSI